MERMQDPYDSLVSSVCILQHKCFGSTILENTWFKKLGKL